MNVNFIGCGKVGKTLGKLLQLHNLAQVKGIVTSSFPQARAAAKFIGAGNGYQQISELPPAELYFITVPDDQIKTACESLVAAKLLKPGNLVVHCSGLLSSEVLSSAQELGCLTASIHPLKSFADVAQSVESFAGTYCALEGAKETLSLLKTLFTNLGAVVIPIDKEKKSLYHCAAVLANNYLVTLHHEAFLCYRETGIDESSAKKITSQLMLNALNNLEQFTHQQSLTGPLQRGDLQTIKQHLWALKSKPLLKKIYAALGLSTLGLTEHPTEKKQEFINLFTLLD